MLLAHHVRLVCASKLAHNLHLSQSADTFVRSCAARIPARLTTLHFHGSIHQNYPEASSLQEIEGAPTWIKQVFLSAEKRWPSIVSSVSSCGGMQCKCHQRTEPAPCRHCYNEAATAFPGGRGETEESPGP